MYMLVNHATWLKEYIAVDKIVSLNTTYNSVILINKNEEYVNFRQYFRTKEV